MKKYYKVVDKDDLTSARAWSKVKYKINEWTNAPRNTRLFVFDSLSEANNFCGFEEVIFECEVKGGVKLPGAEWDSDIYDFWKLFNAKIKNKEKITREYMSKKIKLSRTPAVLVKSVKLKKLVPNK